jgi:hypothetical protein
MYSGRKLLKLRNVPAPWVPQPRLAAYNAKVELFRGGSSRAGGLPGRL